MQRNTIAEKNNGFLSPNKSINNKKTFGPKNRYGHEKVDRIFFKDRSLIGTQGEIYTNLHPALLFSRPSLFVSRNSVQYHQFTSSPAKTGPSDQVKNVPNLSPIVPQCLFYKHAPGTCCSPGHPGSFHPYQPGARLGADVTGSNPNSAHQLWLFPLLLSSFTVPLTCLSLVFH